MALKELYPHSLSHCMTKPTNLPECPMKTQIRLALPDPSPIEIFSVHMKTAANLDYPLTFCMLRIFFLTLS